MNDYNNLTAREASALLSVTVDELEDDELNPEEQTIGRYGSLFWEYLKLEHPERFAFLQLEMTLREVCQQVDKEATEMSESIQNSLRESFPRPVTESFLELAQYETKIQAMTEEQVLAEIVYRKR